MNAFKLASKVLSRLTLSVKETVNEYLYLLKPEQHDSLPLSPEDERFIALNRSHWSRSASKKEGFVLVEGFFAASGHNYLLRTGMLAKAVQEKLNLDIMVLFDKPAYKQTLETKKYQSFGIKHFLYIRPGLTAIFNYVKAVMVGLKYYWNLRDIDDVLKLSHNNILFGDLIYDDILKCEKNVYTIEAISSKVLRKLIASLYYYYWYEALFKKGIIHYLIVTHLVYAQYGVLARTALRFKVDVIETNDLMVNFLRSKDYIHRLISPTYHSILNEKIKDYLYHYHDKDALVLAAEQALSNRVKGNVDQFDARLAYRDKVQLSKIQLCKELNIDLDCSKPLVVIFAHVFADAPHSSEQLLFHDYYHWLDQTLQFIATIQDVNWLVKPHPAGKVYSEQGEVEKLVEKARKHAKTNNLFIFPEKVTSANLSEWADAIVTVQGTAGIEFACFGLPVILAGKAFYSEEGFTFDPTSRENYFSLLSNIATLPSLTSEQIRQAKLIYSAFMHVMSVQSEIIPSQALDAIWGYGTVKEPNITLGNKIINDLLEQRDPKNELQYLRLKEYLG